MRRPSFQFYPGDWLSKLEVRACSTAARGLWMDMICLMHEGEPYGHLTLNGKVVLPPILAKICGTSIEEVEILIAELEGVGVFSRTEEGVIYCRRMVRDERNRQVRAEGGFKSLDNPNVPKPKTPEGIPSPKTEGIPSDSPSGESFEGSPSSSSSSLKEKRSRSQSSRSRPSECDEDWLKELQAKPAYQSLDVAHCYSKMLAWCEVKSKQPTRLRLINWLNREDRPLQAAQNGNSNGHNGNGATSSKNHFCDKCDHGFLPPLPGETSAHRCSCVAKKEVAA